MSTLNVEHLKHENSSSNNVTMDSDGSVAFDTNTLYVDAASNNVGIGTSSPGGKLDVFSSAAANVALFRAGAGQNSFISVIGNGNSFLSTSFDMIQDTLNQAQLAQRANAPMLFSTNNTERMRIDSAGRVTMPYQPAFNARRTAGSVSSGVVLWNSIVENIGGHYNSSTGRFTAPVAGRYYFGAQGILGNAGSLSNGLMGLRKNGSTIHLSHYNMSDAWENCSITSVITLAVDDYVDIEISGTTNGSFLYGDSIYSNFCGYLIG